MHRILIVDDHDVVREGVRRILETQDWEVVGEAANGQEAIRLHRQLKPDAVVMDITMPVMNGLDATHEITKYHPESKVLILTMHENGFQPAIERSGAKGMVTKSRATDELTPALKAILAGHTHFN
jgi:two-component system, NarL family, nitrate/nitrite response regulator NarL